MTTQLKPIIHGRDHAADGADPIPGLLSPPSGATDAAILATVPGAYYKLNETTGNWQDSSGAGRHATYIARTGTVRGVASGLDEGDGSLAAGVHGGAPGAAHGDAHVGQADGTFFQFAGTAPFSVTARVRPSSLPAGGFSAGICGNILGLTAAGAGASGFGLFVQGTSGKPFLFRRGAAGAPDEFIALSSVALTVGEWVRLTGTFDGTTLELYIDETHVATQAASGNLYAGTDTDNFLIGGCGISEGFGGTQAPWEGDIDSVAVWGRALPAEEVGGIVAAAGGSAGNVPVTDGQGSVTWVPAAVPTGGSAGQVLTKDTTTDYDTSWQAPTGGGGTGHTIQDEGTPLTARTGLNFVGAGVTAADDAANNRTDITIPAGGIPPTLLDAKGDLIAASAADTAARLAVGTNGQVLTADSAQATGVRWASPSASGITWHSVGGASEPPFTNGWVNFGSGWLLLQFGKDLATGIVYIQGAVKSGTMAASIFTLPVGFRPAGALVVPAASAGAFAQLNVAATGTVTPTVGNPSDLVFSGFFAAV